MLSTPLRSETCGRKYAVGSDWNRSSKNWVPCMVSPWIKTAFDIIFSDSNCAIIIPVSIKDIHFWPKNLQDGPPGTELPAKRTSWAFGFLLNILNSHQNTVISSAIPQKWYSRKYLGQRLRTTSGKTINIQSKRLMPWALLLFPALAGNKQQRQSPLDRK